MIAKALEYIRGKKYISKKLQENSEYLVPGEYVYDDTLTYIYLENKYHQKEIYDVFGRSLINPFYRIILWFIKKGMFNKKIVMSHSGNNKQNLLGEVCFLGIYKINDVKVFDFQNNKVLTIFSDENKYKNTIDNYAFFKDFLPTPKIIDFDSKDLIIIEALIEAKSSDRWSKEETNFVMEDIFKRYLNYFYLAKEKGDYILENPIVYLEGIVEEDLVRDYLSENISDELLNGSFPCLKLHGDLWARNILVSTLNNHEIKYIDFEFSDDYILFYDFFWFIYDQAINYENSTLLDKYVTGEFDSYFKKIFHLFDISFHSECRKDYFNIFFANLYFKKWNKLSGKSRSRQFKKYKELMSRYE